MSRRKERPGRKDKSMIVETDLSYAAGLMDGEGSICIREYIYKTPGHNIPAYSLYVEIRMTNREPVEFIKAKFGGSLKSKGVTKTGKTIYDWKIYTKKAAIFLTMIYPFLKCKHRQAGIAIKFSNLPNVTKTNIDEIIKKRKNMKRLISRLNQTSHGINTGEQYDY